MTSPTGRRAENGSAAPRPKRTTRSGLRPGIPMRLARSERKLATSTDWFRNACFRPIAVAFSAKRWHARPTWTQLAALSSAPTKTANPAEDAILAAVFLLSAGGKLADRAGTLVAVRGFGVPQRYVTTLAWLLPAAELAVVATVLIPATAWLGGLGAVLLLAVFTVGIAVNLGAGRTPDCRCFGQLSKAPISTKLIARNLVLSIPAFIVLIAG